jgi:hypothetical protein
MQSTKEENTMNTELKQAISKLKAAHTKFATGMLKPVQHGDARAAALIKGVLALAKGLGVTLAPIYQIDARGEMRIVAKGGMFGEEFSSALNTHCNPRQGSTPGATLSARSTWCYINHFDIEKLVMAFDA